MSWPAGAVPAGDGDRAGRFGQDPAPFAGGDRGLELPAAQRARTAGVPGTGGFPGPFTLQDNAGEMGLLDVQAGQADDATGHLREALQAAVRTGSAALIDCLDDCGHLCAAAHRHAEAVTVWAAYAALLPEGYTDPPLYVRRRQEPLRRAREALGPAGARAAEDRGAAMSMDTAPDLLRHQRADPAPPRPRPASTRTR